LSFWESIDVFNSDRPEEWIDQRLMNPAAGVPHLITALDAALLNAIVRINGAKPAVWNNPAPYDADDRYEPFRENVPLSEWALPYNQRELLSSLDFGAFQPPLLIVDTNTSEKVLAAAGENWPADPSTEFQGFGELVARVGWLLTAVDAEHKWALFATHTSKSDYVGLLQHWCHEHGRTFCTLVVAEGKTVLQAYAAPEENRKRAVYNEGSQFLGKMGMAGISAAESLAHLRDLLEELKQRHEQ
jgi:hypothetical protein